MQKTVQHGEKLIIQPRYLVRESASEQSRNLKIPNLDILKNVNAVTKQDA